MPRRRLRARRSASRPGTSSHVRQFVHRCRRRAHPRLRHGVPMHLSHYDPVSHGQLHLFVGHVPPGNPTVRDGNRSARSRSPGTADRTGESGWTTCPSCCPRAHSSRSSRASPFTWSRRPRSRCGSSIASSTASSTMMPKCRAPACSSTVARDPRSCVSRARTNTPTDARRRVRRRDADARCDAG